MADVFPIKTYDEIREDYLRTYRNGLIALGISNPDVSPGTEIYLKASATAQTQSVLYAGLIVQDDQRMPDTATGEALERWCALYDLTRQAAASSSGYLDFTSSIASVLIPTGSQLTDGSGQRFTVSTGGTFTTGQRVPIDSVSTGVATNLAASAPLRWVSAPPFVNSRATVSTGGLVGGAEAETYSALRLRLLERLRAKPGSHNWSDLNSIAEAADPLVQKAFTYPAYSGPASVLVAVTRAASDTNRDRDIDDPIILNRVTSALVGNLPAWADIQLRTVENSPTNVSIGLSLSEGQWLDVTPFPVYGSHAEIQIVNASNDLELNSDTAPTAGVSHLCWVDRSTWTLRRAIVTSFSVLGPDNYRIILDVPFTGIVAGDWVFPDSIRMADYLAALLEVFSNLGPGQLLDSTTYPSLYPRANRRPVTASEYPSSIGPSVLRFLSNVGQEVLDVSYLYRSQTDPPYVASLLDNPQILVPQLLAFYPQD